MSFDYVSVLSIVSEKRYIFIVLRRIPKLFLKKSGLRRTNDPQKIQRRFLLNCFDFVGNQ